jgi:predicted RNA-binding protein
LVVILREVAGSTANRKREQDMCLSTVYQGNTETKPIAEFVTEVKLENGIIALTDITGEQTEIQGEVKSVDLIKNIIIIQ